MAKIKGQTKYKFIEGDTFGKWTILNSQHIVKEGGYVHFLCKCECGTERYVDACNVDRNISNNCGCVKRAKIPVNYKGIGDLSGKYFNRIRQGAITRNIEFNITISDIFTLYTGYCALSGLEIEFNRNTNKQTASLDRIDSSKGYIMCNVQWVHKTVNMMKKDLKESEFIRFCKGVALTK